jgi:hypothetical protein
MSIEVQGASAGPVFRGIRALQQLSIATYALTICFRKSGEAADERMHVTTSCEMTYAY